MKYLTGRQKELLNYLQNYIEKYENPPSCSEIQSHFGFASSSSVYKHLQILEEKGFIQINRFPTRLISLNTTEKKSVINAYHFPLVGYLNDEGDIEQVSKIKKIAYGSDKKFSLNCYLLKIKGGNFLESGLLHEDLIIIEPRSEAITGETVLVKVYNEQFTIKKYQPKGAYTRLDSFCMQIEPMMVLNEEVSIHGVLLGVIRKYALVN